MQRYYQKLFIAGGVYGCEMPTVLSAAGVHGHCYCRGVHSPCANAKDALRELYSAISEQQTNNPDGFFIIAGDFNHANLKTVLPKFYQHVNFATRGNNTLDFVYTTVKHAYKAEPRPPRILGPHLCYANPSIQTASQTGQTGSKADHGMARQCYLSTAGLLPGHRLEHV